jgi:hypothetical protein
MSKAEYSANISVFIGETLTDLEKTSKELDKLTKELEEFLKDYFARTIGVNEGESVSPSLRKQRLKELYFALSKYLHPDVGGDAQLFQQVKQAYDNGDIACLTAIFNEMKLNRLSKLGHEAGLGVAYLAFDNNLKRLKSELENLKTSQEYQLLQKARLYKLIGLDLAEEVLLAG